MGRPLLGKPLLLSDVHRLIDELRGSAAGQGQSAASRAAAGPLAPISITRLASLSVGGSCHSLEGALFLERLPFGDVGF